MDAFYQYHGWIALRVTPTCEEYEDSEETRIIHQVREYIKSLDYLYVLDMKAINGNYHVWMTGNPNHKPQKKDLPEEIFREIGRLAPGSYGLLYVWDDEDNDGFRNAFRVYVLARGEVQERLDPFLSPCIPVFEDPCT